MFRRLLVLAFALALVGCCRSSCNPCHRRCNPCQPPCPPPPPPGGGGSGDTNCAVWATQDCDLNMPGLQSRDWLVRAIRTEAVAAGNGAAVGHCDQYLNDKNCKGNSNDGPDDCAPIGALNCQCLLDAYNAVKPGVQPNWPVCLTKLQQGH